MLYLLRTPPPYFVLVITSVKDSRACMPSPRTATFAKPHTFHAI